MKKQIHASHEETASIHKMEKNIQLIRKNLTTLDFNMKRLILEMLDIKDPYIVK